MKNYLIGTVFILGLIIAFSGFQEAEASTFVHAINDDTLKIDIDESRFYEKFKNVPYFDNQRPQLYFFKVTEVTTGELLLDLIGDPTPGPFLPAYDDIKNQYINYPLNLISGNPYYFEWTIPQCGVDYRIVLEQRHWHDYVNIVEGGDVTINKSCTIENISPDAPTNPIGTVSENTVYLTWSAPTNEGSSDITRYDVKYRLAGDPRWLTIEGGVFDGTNFEFNIEVTGIYEIQVYAISNAGTSVGSSIVTVSVPKLPSIDPVFFEIDTTKKNTIKVTIDQGLVDAHFTNSYFYNFELERPSGQSDLSTDDIRLQATADSAWSSGYFLNHYPNSGLDWYSGYDNTKEYFVEWSNLECDVDYDVSAFTTVFRSGSMGYTYYSEPYILEQTTVSVSCFDTVSQSQSTVNPDSTVQKKKSGGGNEWDTRPTFGLNHKTLRPVVECGFSFDGTCYDVTDNWHTDFDKIEITTNSTHLAEIKVLAEKKLRYIEFELGIPQVGKSGEAEVSIFADFDHQGVITDFGINGDSDAIDNLYITNLKVKCQDSDTIDKCDVIYISFDSVEPLQNDVIGLQAIDYKNRVQTTYLNEGINFSGDSLNPMDTKMIVGTEKYEGLIEVTQTTKFSDIWIADNGREFQSNDYDTFAHINKVINHGETNNRLHNIATDAEKDKAMMVLSEVCPKCNDEHFDKLYDTFAYDIITLLDRDDPEYKRLILLEEYKARKLLEKLN